MTTSMFIKFDGIDGESTSKDHKGEIELLSWGWGLSAQVLTSGSGGGSAVGKVTPREFRFVHHYDKASPVLMRHAATGKHVASAVMTERRAGAGQKDFLKITLKDVLVTSIEAGDDGHGPTEQVAIVFGDIAFSYVPQTATGGTATPVTVDWNVKTGAVS